MPAAQIKRKRNEKFEDKENILEIRKEKNREKAQIFRQRKKEYITSLENKVKELEAKVYDLTLKLESYQYEKSLSSLHEGELFAELDSINFGDSPTYSKSEEVLDVEAMCGKQEKLMLLFNKTPVKEHSDSFKYFGKMGSYMKTEILHRDNLNIVERFLLDCDMTPDQIQRDFQNYNISQLNKAMKSVAETIIDTKRNYECLKKLSTKALDCILKNFDSSQIHKFAILSEELTERGELTAAKIWQLEGQEDVKPSPYSNF